MNLINSDRIKYINVASYLILLLPIFIIFSRFAADLIVVILSLFFLLICKKNELIKNKVILLASIFILFSVISSLLSSHLIISLKSSLLHFRFIFFLIMISFIFLYSKENFLRNFFYIFLICYLALLFDATIQYIFKENILGYIVEPKNRVSSFFFDELILGSFLSRFFPLIFFLSIFLKLKINKYLIIYFLTHLYFVVFISGERLSFLILNIYYLLFIPLLFQKKITKLIFFLIPIIIFLFLMIIGSNFEARTSFNKIKSQSVKFNYSVCNETEEQIKSSKVLFERWNYVPLNTTISQMKANTSDARSYIPNCHPIIKIFGTDIYYIFSVMHFNHYLSAIEMFKDNKLLGIGPKNFRNICKDEKYFLNEFSCSTHPHNYYIQLLSETGIVGFSLFLSIYCFFFYLFLSNFFKVNNNYFLLKHVLISCFLINFFPLFPSGNFFNNWNAIVYTLPLGFLVGLYKKIINE